MQYYLLLITGFIILLFSGNYLIKGSISIAQKYKVSKLVIGVTLVSFGTSAPELFVSVIAAIQKQSEISVGNIVGSNITDPLFALGIGAVISGFLVEKRTLLFDFPFWLVGTIIALALLYDHQDLDNKESIVLISHRNKNHH